MIVKACAAPVVLVSLEPVAVGRERGDRQTHIQEEREKRHMR
jgi:hypothetical protein